MIINQAHTIGELRDYLLTPSDEIEVFQGEWRYGVSKLTTMSVASCVVLAAHNRSTKRGMIGHFSCISPTAQSNPQLSNEQFDTNAFNNSVDYLPNLGLLSDTQIWLGGAALYTDDSTEIRNGTLADRLYAEARVADLVRRYGVVDDVIIRDWNTTENELYIRLDCESGSLFVQPVAE
jgi:chemotaxis receptor (MCP) glutamine deamidase CheD